MYLATLSEVISAVYPQLDGELFCNESVGRIHSIAQCIPSGASNLIGFERTLGAPKACVDFSLGLTAFGEDWLVSNRLWPVIADIFNNNVNSVQRNSLTSWIEFDSQYSDWVVDPPSFYLGFDPLVTPKALMIERAIQLSTDSKVFADSIARAIVCIPDSFQRLYVGSMPSRIFRGVRVSVVGVKRRELADYLAAIRWPGDFRAVVAELDLLVPPNGRLGVQLNVGSQVDEWLGIELPLNKYRTDKHDEDDVKLLERMRDTNRCSSSEFDALQKWPSRIDFVAPLLDRFIDARCPQPGQRFLHGAILTGLHHYKLSFHVDGSIGTKAYFGIHVNLR